MNGLLWRSVLAFVAILLSGLIHIGGCQIGEPGPSWDINLPVPFYAQEQDHWCGVAIIKMLRKYYTGDTVSQSSIAAAYDVTYPGINEGNFILGLRQNSGSPLVLFALHKNYSQSLQAKHMSHEITAAEEDGHPSIGVDQHSGSNVAHAMVIKGGNYTYYQNDPELGEFYLWDDVLFHDSDGGSGGSNIEQLGGWWMTATCCTHIVDSAWVPTANNRYSQYGSITYVRGGGGGGGHDWPPEY